MGDLGLPSIFDPPTGQSNLPKEGDTRVVNGVTLIFHNGAWWTYESTPGGTPSYGHPAGPKDTINPTTPLDQNGVPIAPVPGKLDPVEQAKQQDIFDAPISSRRLKGYLSSQMHRGYRSSFLIGPRGLEGPDWIQPAIDWAAYIDQEIVQGPTVRAPGERPPPPTTGGPLPADRPPPPLPTSPPPSGLAPIPTLSEQAAIEGTTPGAIMAARKREWMDENPRTNLLDRWY